MLFYFIHAGQEITT